MIVDKAHCRETNSGDYEFTKNCDCENCYKRLTHDRLPSNRVVGYIKIKEKESNVEKAERFIKEWKCNSLESIEISWFRF